MTRPRAPMVLRAWLLATRCLPWPLKMLSRFLHNRMGAPSARFAERLGQASLGDNGPVIWFHAASLGEVTQIRPLSDALARSLDATILVTTTTSAGADWVAREMPFALHQFAPLDIPSAVSAFLDHWSISAAIFVEGDLWPRLVIETGRRKIPQILLNARDSRTRKRFASVFGYLLSGFDLVTCRSRPVADGILSLGVPTGVVTVLPDLRLAAPKLPCSADLMQHLAERIGSRPVWLAASTHPDDEAAVMAAHGHVMSSFPDALLILAPRHPRRGARLRTMAIDQKFDVAQRSQGEELGSTTQIYIADTLGELGAFFATAPVVFLGGSFGDEGGHNPYEPASFGAAIVAGSKVKNFADAYAALSDAGAAVQLEDPSYLGQTLTQLIGSDQGRLNGQAALNFMQASEDGIAAYAKLITDILHDRKR